MIVYWLFQNSQEALKILSSIRTELSLLHRLDPLLITKLGFKTSSNGTDNGDER